MLSRLTLRPRLLAALVALTAAGFAFLLIGSATKAPAEVNNNNTTCWGGIKKGDPDPDDPSAVPIAYSFQCDGKITGYSLVTAPERQVIGAETEVSVTNGDGEVVGSDSFSCNGTFPGYGINCVSPAGGDYKTPGDFIKGQFFVNRNRCANPRLDPILTVTYATANDKKQVVQAIAGPFDLGQAVDCPKPRSYARDKFTRRKIPVEQDQVLTGQEERRRR
ncbi:MAG: hypothetical protein WKF96_05045 [Solirubrobacteraceae bacterium]